MSHPVPWMKEVLHYLQIAVIRKIIKFKKEMLLIVEGMQSKKVTATRHLPKYYRDCVHI